MLKCIYRDACSLNCLQRNYYKKALSDFKNLKHILSKEGRGGQWILNYAGNQIFILHYLIHSLKLLVKYNGSSGLVKISSVQTFTPISLIQSIFDCCDWECI